MSERNPPGTVRDAITQVFHEQKRALSLSELQEMVAARLGSQVAPSSIRSYLNLNTARGHYERTRRGTYRLTGR